MRKPYYYPSRNSLASAPPPDTEQEITRFLPTKSPAISRKSSVNAIRRVDSVGLEMDFKDRQPPQNYQVPGTRTYTIR